MPISVPGGNPSSLGKVTVASSGTPVALTANFPGLASPEAIKNGSHLCAWISVQALGDNTVAGHIYVGSATMNIATLAGVLMILGPGESGSLNLDDVPNGLNINDFYIDAEDDGDAVLAVMAGR